MDPMEENAAVQVTRLRAAIACKHEVTHKTVLTLIYFSRHKVNVKALKLTYNYSNS